MDLHGLHVAEALTQLSKQIGGMQGSSNPPRLTVVTGAGLHTKVRHLSRLPAHLRARDKLDGTSAQPCSSKLLDQRCCSVSNGSACSCQSSHVHTLQ